MLSARSAAVPAACPMMKQGPDTRADDWPSCDIDAQRPATSRLSIFWPGGVGTDAASTGDRMVILTLWPIEGKTWTETRPSDEVKVMSGYLSKRKDDREGYRGVLWILLNSSEFVLNH